MPYKSIYRCTCCSGEEFNDPDGVCEFATDSSNQTIPVSHFDDINKAKIWLILTNPSGRVPHMQTVIQVIQTWAIW